VGLFPLWGRPITFSTVKRDAPAENRTGNTRPEGRVAFASLPLHLRMYLSHLPAHLQSETAPLTGDDARAACRPGQVRCLMLPCALRDPVAWGQ
jgi:hypothetical protein